MLSLCLCLVGLSALFCGSSVAVEEKHWQVCKMVQLELNYYNMG